MEDGTTIYSDFWKAYDCLEDEGFIHATVNHSLRFKEPETMLKACGAKSEDLFQSLEPEKHYSKHLAEFIARNRFRGKNFSSKSFLLASTGIKLHLGFGASGLLIDI